MADWAAASAFSAALLADGQFFNPGLGHLDGFVNGLEFLPQPFFLLFGFLMFFVTEQPPDFTLARGGAVQFLLDGLFIFLQRFALLDGGQNVLPAFEMLAVFLQPIAHGFNIGDFCHRRGDATKGNGDVVVVIAIAG